MKERVKRERKINSISVRNDVGLENVCLYAVERLSFRCSRYDRQLNNSCQNCRSTHSKVRSIHIHYTPATDRTARPATDTAISKKVKKIDKIRV